VYIMILTGVTLPAACKRKEMARNDEPPIMLKTSDLAEILHVHPNTVRRWSEQGRIGAYRIGSRGDRRFTQNEVARFIGDFNPFKQDEQ